ncbi:MAG: putative quinol monooxygenase [Pseudomonadota bacterium]
MTDLTIVASVVAVADKIELVKSELEKLVDTTRQEAGCVRYDLHQNNDDPTHFLFYETWTSRALWRAHMEAAHLTAFGQATEGAVAKFELFEMTHIA